MNYQPAHFSTLKPPEEFERHPVKQPPEVDLREIGKGAYWARSFSNAGWIVTDEGVVLVDSGSNRQEVFDALRKTTDKPIRYVIYTHGHGDHTLRMDAFQQIASPDTQVIAQAFMPERLDRYEFLREHVGRINGIQFTGSRPPNAPRPAAATARPPVKYPDILYHGEYRFELGGRRFLLFHVRAETDDATIVYAEDDGIIFAGDCLISSWPNFGNPYKVPRYCRGWFEGLEKVKGLNPRVVAPGHGDHLLTSEQEISGCLDAHIGGLRYVHDEVVRRLNEGQPHSQMVDEIHLPPELESSPFLEQSYSRVELAVTAIRREYTGWYDGDPADLYPHDRRIVAESLRELAANDDAFVAKAAALWAAGRRTDGLEILQILLRATPDHVEGRRLRLSFMESLLVDDRTLMSRGLWHTTANADREFLAGREYRPLTTSGL